MGICQQDAFQDRSQRIQGLYSWLDFYKFLSDNEVNYLKSIGWTDEDLVTLVDDHDNQEAVMMMEYCRNNIGYFIEYKNLFGTWLKPNSEFSVADLSGALNSFDRLISPNYKHVYENIFKTLQAGCVNWAKIPHLKHVH